MIVDTVTEGYSPETVYRKGFSVARPQRTPEITRSNVECIDSAIPEVTDQQRITEFAKICGSHYNPPRCIELPACNEAIDEAAVCIINIDEPQPFARYIIMFCCILFGISYVEVASDIVDAEGRKAGRYFRVAE